MPEETHPENMKSSEDEAVIPELVEEPENALDPEGETTLSNIELQTLLDKAEQTGELQDKLLRSAAELDNYRKRAQREKEDAVRYATQSIIEQLLPVIDNFEMGMQAVEQSHDPAAIAQGMKMIHAQLQSTMNDLGVEAIAATPGADFDHNIHDAVSTEASEEHPEGTIISQARKGYKVKGKLVRPASVTVAKGADE